MIKYITMLCFLVLGFALNAQDNEINGNSSIGAEHIVIENDQKLKSEQSELSREDNIKSQLEKDQRDGFILASKYKGQPLSQEELNAAFNQVKNEKEELKRLLHQQYDWTITKLTDKIEDLQSEKKTLSDKGGETIKLDLEIKNARERIIYLREMKEPVAKQLEMKSRELSYLKNRINNLK